MSNNTDNIINKGSIVVKNSKLLWRLVNIGTISAVCLFTAACSSKPKSSALAAFEGVGSPKYKGRGKPPKVAGAYKIGKPYKIAGRWYKPREQPNYNKVGMASWYGPKFHGRKTANGEWFDMNEMTAAHTTLPIPSYAKVTNLKNNKSIIVRINDRGPYAHNRVIDLSKKSAEALDFRSAGVAKVRVKYIGKAPLKDDGSHLLAMNRKLRSGGKIKLASRNIQHSVIPTGKPELTKYQSSNAHQYSKAKYNIAGMNAHRGIYVQAASFSSEANAIKARNKLSNIGNVKIAQMMLGQRKYYQVRVGPWDNHDSANNALENIRNRGLYDAMIVSIN